MFENSKGIIGIDSQTVWNTPPERDHPIPSQVGKQRLPFVGTSQSGAFEKRFLALPRTTIDALRQCGELRDFLGRAIDYLEANRSDHRAPQEVAHWLMGKGDKLPKGLEEPKTEIPPNIKATLYDLLRTSRYETGGLVGFFRNNEAPEKTIEKLSALLGHLPCGAPGKLNGLGKMGGASSSPASSRSEDPDLQGVERRAYYISLKAENRAINPLDTLRPYHEIVQQIINGLGEGGKLPYSQLMQEIESTLDVEPARLFDSLMKSGPLESGEKTLKKAIWLNEYIKNSASKAADNFACYDYAGRQIESQICTDERFNLRDEDVRIFFANFDGSGMDAAKGTGTQIGEIHNSIGEKGISRTYSYYMEGCNTNESLREVVPDFITGGSFKKRVDSMYAELCAKTYEWKADNPNAKVRVIATGYSRGAPMAAIFCNMVDRRGIENPQLTGNWAGKCEGGGEIEGSRPHLVEPGEIKQAVLLIDPVPTGDMEKVDRSLPASVVSGLQITARDEKRSLFTRDEIINRENNGEGQFLNLVVPGTHDNMGGVGNALGQRTANLASSYLNRLIGARNLYGHVYAPPSDDAGVIEPEWQRLLNTMGFISGRGYYAEPNGKGPNLTPRALPLIQNTPPSFTLCDGTPSAVVKHDENEPFGNTINARNNSDRVELRKERAPLRPVAAPTTPSHWEGRKGSARGYGSVLDVSEGMRLLLNNPESKQKLDAILSSCGANETSFAHLGRAVGVATGSFPRIDAISLDDKKRAIVAIYRGGGHPENGIVVEVGIEEVVLRDLERRAVSFRLDSSDAISLDSSDGIRLDSLDDI